MDNTKWLNDVKQLKGYDQKLEKLGDNTHDIIFITDTLLTRKFWNYITQIELESDAYKFERKLCVCQFARQDKVDVILVVRKDYGKLSDNTLDNDFSDGKRMNLKNIITEIDSTKFYDANPNVLYTMEILWDFVFPKQIAEKDYRFTPMNKSIKITMTIDQILEFVRHHFAPKGNQNVVRRAWIRNAMDKFVEINLAQEIVQGQYRIEFRKRIGKKITRNFLLNLVYPEENSAQMKLDSFR